MDGVLSVRRGTQFTTIGIVAGFIRSVLSCGTRGDRIDDRISVCSDVTKR